MRPSFLPRLVNGPLFDPVVYVRPVNGKRSVMFDCGHFLKLSDREMLAVDTICVSHAHMDHFMGFDLVLRKILHRDAPLNVIGPEGIAAKVLSKLQSYTWNLTKGYCLKIAVHEVFPRQMRIVRLGADSGFSVCSDEVRALDGATVLSAPRYLIDAAILDHAGIPSMAYVLKEPLHVGIRRRAMEKRGYVRGQWLGHLKECVLAERLDKMIPVRTLEGLAQVQASKLKEELVVEAKGQKIAFVTDMAYTEENISRLEGIARDADMLFIEAFYLDELQDIALGKGHLTARQAGMIARRLNSRRVMPMHVSPRYHERWGGILEEMGITLEGRLAG